MRDDTITNFLIAIFLAAVTLIVVLTVGAEAKCLTKSEARDIYSGERLYWSGPDRCWSDRRGRARARLERRHKSADSDPPPAHNDNPKIEAQEPAVLAPAVLPAATISDGASPPLSLAASPLAAFKPTLLDLTPVEPAADADAEGGVWPDLVGQAEQEDPAESSMIPQLRVLAGYIVIAAGLLLVIATAFFAALGLSRAGGRTRIFPS